jgi:hypothetical protein
MLNRLYLLIYIMLVSILLPLKGIAQSTESEIEEHKFQIKNPRKKSISIHFELLNNLIVLPVVINDSDTLHFILDSGFNSIMISDLGYNTSLSLNQTRRVQLVGLGEGEPIQAFRSQGNDLYVSGISGRDQEVYVLVDDIFHLSSKMGKTINGVLGHGFFRDFIIEINYVQKRLTFHDPERYRYRKRKNSEEFPLVIVKNKSYLQTFIVNEDDKSIPALLVVDTGGSHGLWLDSHTNEAIRVPERNVSTLLGTGLNGSIFGKIGRINEFKIGSYKLENVIASYPDSISISYAIGVDNRQGSLGAEILRRFNIIFDYPAGKITLRPNNNFKQAFYYNPSGIEVSNPLPGLPLFVITDVRAGSNAQKAGIQLEDELISIQGNAVSKMTLNDISLILQGKPGRNIKLIVKRQGQRIPIEFRLEEVI